MSITNLFGAENIRTSEMHAKFVLIENANYKLTIISSMNLNANKTCETFQIYTESSVFDFYMSFVTRHFNDLDNGFDGSAASITKSLNGWFNSNESPQISTNYKHWSNE
jgi:hypothetical protein